MPLADGQDGLLMEFWSSVNPIPTKGADFAHHITACPPRSGNLTASLSPKLFTKGSNPILKAFSRKNERK